MIKRRSTLDHTQKIKKNKLVETLNILDMCLQIPADDRLILRNKIKSGDEELSSRVYKCKKDKDYHQLQVYLRKYLNNAKNTNRFGYSSFKNRQTSSRKNDNTPSVRRLTKNVQTQNSNKTSLKGSYHTSPQHSTHCRQIPLKIPDFNQIQKKLQFDIHKQKISNSNIKNQQQISVMKQIEDKQRQFHTQNESVRNISKYSQNINYFRNQFTDKIRDIKTQSNINHTLNNNMPINIKSILKQKLKTQQDNSEFNPFIQHNKDIQHNKENRLIIDKNTNRNQRLITQQNPAKYGQFYKRIKMAIQDDI